MRYKLETLGIGEFTEDTLEGDLALYKEDHPDCKWEIIDEFVEWMKRRSI